MVYLEAMSFGLPCIATTAGAAGEVIASGETGWLVPPEDASALAERLQRLADDPSLLECMSLAARQRYKAHPTWENTGEKVRDFLQTLV
jgi:glycosyltransferase involved in cell wall biosynthesis